MNLKTKVSALNRVGKKLSSKLKKLGIETVGDLLNHYPFRYEDFSETKPISELEEGDEITIKGKIEQIATRRSPRKRKLLTEAVVSDETDSIRVIWFGQPFISKVLKMGDTVYLSGKVKKDMFGAQLVSPSYEKAKSDSIHTARIVPIYPTTTGVTQKQLRYLISQVTSETENIEEWLPEDILDQADLINLNAAVKSIHFPESLEEQKAAEKRLKFDELFLLQLRAEMIRQQMRSNKAPEISFKDKETREFVGELPFELTRDQKIAAWQILQDIGKDRPMNRLLEGDVGSGKTVVAGLVANSALLSGFQVAILAPTDILATQHFVSLKKMFSKKEIKVGLFNRTKKLFSKKGEEEKISKKKFIENLASGDINLVVGTHALLIDEVGFKSLGLVVVDEQHRFGVGQRKTIREKSGDPNTWPHFLSMTATPIPRSFALTLYGDLDLSQIKELPGGRKPVLTRLVDPHNRHKAYDFIRTKVKEGRQVFVICPLIESEDEKKSVMSEYEKLNKEIFPELTVGYLHGKMKATDKHQSMQEFADGKVGILVSTSVVEVGVNVPNAAIMMIEGAERFGLAQLHQFRGRVGRSSYQSYCFLFTDSESYKAKQRLEFFEKTTDGFKVAEYDLQTRGPGEVYGTNQSGMMNLRLANLQDINLIKLARRHSCDIDFEKYPLLFEKVKQWEEQVHLE